MGGIGATLRFRIAKIIAFDIQDGSHLGNLQTKSASACQVGLTHHPYTHCYDVSSKYFLRLPSYA